MRARHRPTTAVIDLGALARNFQRIHERVAPGRIWAVVKADAYGHGAVEVASRLAVEGCEAFAVATVDEGAELREAGIEQEILVMGGIEPLESDHESAAVGGAERDGSAAETAAEIASRHSLTVAVWNPEAAEALAAAARDSGQAPVPVQLKVDTGMGRLGVPAEEAPDLARALECTEGVRFDGVFSNLASSDAAPGEPGHDHTCTQVERFERLCDALSAEGLSPPHRHLANSAGIMQHPDSWDADWCTGVRPGLTLYGASLTVGRDPVPLEPVMALGSAVAAIRELPEGWPLGYGAVRRTEKDSRIAVVPVGYHDGWPRTLSGNAEVVISGQRAKVVGTISMDLTLVDITAIPEVRSGDPVVLIGSSGEAASIRAEEVASWADSIAHEILCRLGARVPRRFVDSSS